MARENLETDFLRHDPDFTESATPERDKISETGTINAAIVGVVLDPNRKRLIEQLHLSDEDMAFLKRATTSFGSKMKALCDSRISEDFLRHDPKNGVFAYRLPAFVEEGKLAMSEYKQCLKARLGNHRANVVVDNVMREYAFACYGQKELWVQFSQDSGGKMSWKATLLQPDGARFTGVSLPRCQHIWAYRGD
jgi:hypothetical protein